VQEEVKAVHEGHVVEHAASSSVVESSTSFSHPPAHTANVEIESAATHHESPSSSNVMNVDSSDTPAPIAPPAPLPFPILRGTLRAEPTLKDAFKHTWSGQWSMTLVDPLESVFSYNLEVVQPSKVTKYTPPTHENPDGVANKFLPSHPSHPVVSFKASGYYFVLGLRNSEADLRINIGGDVSEIVLPSHIPALPDMCLGEYHNEKKFFLWTGQAIPREECIKMTGKGTNRQLGDFELLGLYHPRTGSMWAWKAYKPKVAKPRTSTGSATKSTFMDPAMKEANKLLSDASAFVSHRTSRDVKKPTSLSLDDVDFVVTGDLRLLFDLIVRKLRANPLAASFIEDVDEVRHEAPGYYEKVTNPMSINKLLERFKAGSYNDDSLVAPEQYPANITAEDHLTHGLLAFYNDVLLIANAARTYNPPGHFIVTQAESFEATFRETLFPGFLHARKVAEEKRLRARLAKEAMRAASFSSGGGGDSASGMEDDLSESMDETGVRKPRKTAGKKRSAYGDEDEDDGGYGGDDGYSSAQKRPRASLGGSTGGRYSTGGGSFSDSAAMLKQMESLRNQVAMMNEAMMQMAKAQTAGFALGSGFMAPSMAAAASMPAVRAASGAASKKPRKQKVSGDDSDYEYGDYDSEEDRRKKLQAATAARRKSTPALPTPTAAKPAASASASGPRPSSASSASSGLVPLTFEEKQSISSDVALLQQSQIDRVLQIIQERMPVETAGGEIELDMDSLDTSTLREIQKYVASCLGRPLPVVAQVAAKSAAATAKQTAVAEQSARVAQENMSRMAALGGTSNLPKYDEKEDDAPPPPPPAGF
jgi:Bromodomain extra-terminal - transcription regulation/Bromodomain